MTELASAAAWLPSPPSCRAAHTFAGFVGAPIKHFALLTSARGNKTKWRCVSGAHLPAGTAACVSSKITKNVLALSGSFKKVAWDRAERQDAPKSLKDYVAKEMKRINDGAEVQDA